MSEPSPTAIPIFPSDRRSRLARPPYRSWTALRRSRTPGAASQAQRAVALISIATGIAACSDVPAGDDGAVSRDAAVSSDATAPFDAARASDAPARAICPCFDGDGSYCEGEVAARAAAIGCDAPEATVGGARIFTCASGEWTAGEACEHGCTSGEIGGSAACELPLCECFVRESWCGASAARHGLTLPVRCRIPLVPEHDQDLLGCDEAGDWIVLDECEMGCIEAPTGTPDACTSRSTPEDPGWDPCPHRALLASGLHPEASDRLRCAGVAADRITQTIGTAAASAGYHAADGRVDGLDYTAAVDLRTRDLSETEIRALLDRLGRNGFAAWYRKPGSDGWPADQAPHIHAVFAGVVMKSQLRGQVRDFLLGLNGLASHSTYRFWPPPDPVEEIVRLLFSRHYTPP